MKEKTSAHMSNQPRSFYVVCKHGNISKAKYNDKEKGGYIDDFILNSESLVFTLIYIRLLRGNYLYIGCQNTR